MRTWNCKQMARMISLYVGGDLVGAPEREVAAHLAACDGCRRLAEEFSESQRLLTKACAPPAFGADFYAGIRGAVLGEINSRVPPQPSLFGGRRVFATSLVVAVIAFAVMFQYHRTATETAQRLAFNAAGLPGSARGKGADPSPAPQLSELPPLSQKPRRVTIVRKPDVADTDLTARNNRTELTSVVRSSTSTGRAALESVTLASRSVSSATGRAFTSEVSRIEIRTANPNIRIIWLTPRRPGASGETNHDQDPPENGDRN